MAAVTTYAEVVDLKAHLGLEPSDTKDDAVLALKIVSACRAVDGVCRRRFWRDPAADPTTVRYFRPETASYCLIDDLIVDADTAVALDDSDTGTWASTLTAADYVTHPLNGIGLDGASGWPVTALELTAGGRMFGPYFRHLDVKITGRWGWTAIPAPVFEATLIVAADLFHYKDVRSGTIGFNDFGPVTVRTAIAGHAKSLLSPYRSPRGLLVA